MKNLLTIFFLWLVTLFLFFFTNNLSNNLLGLELFLVVPWLCLYITRKPYYLLVAFLFGLTADSFVFTYPGLNSFSFLLVGSVYSRYRDRFFYEETVGALILMFIALFCYKIIYYTAVYLISPINFFPWFLTLFFWVHILSSMVYGWLLLVLLWWCQRKWKILI